MKLAIWVSEKFEDFWFSPQPLILSSIFRLLVGAVLFSFYTIRFLDFEFLFSEKSPVPTSLASLVIPEGFVPPLRLFPYSESLLYGMHIAFILLLLLLTFGIGGRLTAILTFIFHLGLLQRNVTVVYGADFVSTAWLLYLCLMQTTTYLTLPQLLRKQDFLPSRERFGFIANSKKGGPWNSVGVRFVQVHLCIIYAYSGLEKMKGMTWWRGDAIWNTLGNGQLVSHDFGFLSYIPAVVTAMTFMTLIFEIYFPALIWHPKLKYAMITFGIFLHSGIAISMQLPFFSLVMLISYVMFLTPPAKVSETKS